MTVRLAALSTALPPNVLPQDLVQRRAQALLGPRYPQFERMLSTFVTAGIDTRYSVVPIDWFEQPAGWKERNDRFLEGGTALFEDAATQALAAAGWRADEVDVVVTVTSTGVATPTFEARAQRSMGFRGDAIRVPVFGLGCAGGVAGLGIARDMAAARPGAKVLLVVVECCTLSFRTDRLQKADIIATVLFGDGAAAACLSTTAKGAAIGQGAQHLWPNTLGIMGWDVDDVGLGVVFDRSIPAFARKEFANAVAAAAPGPFDRLVCHPGGTKVVEAIEGAMGLPDGALDAERRVLRQCGNMSAPTALFVLKEALEGRAKGAGPGSETLLCALGPGFTAAMVPVTLPTTYAKAPGRAAEMVPAQ